MDESLIVRLELDDSSVNKTLDSASKKANEKFSNSFSSDGSAALASSLANLDRSLQEISSTMKDLNQNTRELERANDGLFGTIAGGAKIAALGLAGMVAAYGLFNGLGRDLQAVGQFYSNSGKGLYNFADAAIATTGKLGLLTAAVSTLDGELADATLKVLGFATAASAALTVAVVLLIDKVAELAFNIGSKLSAAFRETYNEFIVFRKETVQFTEIIKAYEKETNGASGSTAAWNERIKELNQSLNFSVGELRKSTAELVAVGSRLGLTEDQVASLLKVVSDYATISGKDLFQTTVAFATALQGNAQAVQAYGVKLTEASNATFAFKNGMSKSFNQMTELEKEQVRYNNLMAQYSTVAGVATTVANDWFNQTKKLEATQARLNTQIGEGAAYVEDLNLVAAATNKILSNVSDSTARLFGFLGALGGRLLQIIGFFIEWSFKIFLVYRAIQLLDLLLKSNTWTNFATKTLPLLNASLATLAGNAAKAEVSLSGLSGVSQTIGKIFQAQKGNIFGFITGVGGAGAGIGSLFSIIATRVSGAATAIVSVLSTILVPLLPIVAVVTAVIGALWGLFEVFKRIDQETKFFSEFWALITRGFQQFIAIFTESGILDSILNGFKTFVGTLFGVFVGFFSQIFSVVASIIQRNPFGVFSKETVAAFTNVNDSLQGLQKRLTAAKGNVFALGETIQASTAPVNKAKFDYEKFAEVVKELNETAGGDVGKIARALQERLNVINAAGLAEVTSAKEIARLRGLAQAEAQRDVNSLIESEIGFAGQTVVEKENSIYEKRKALLANLLNNKLILESRYAELEKYILDQRDKNISAANDKKLSTAEKYMQKFTKLTKDQAERAAAISGQISNSASSLVSGTFQRLGEALINGQSAWSDFSAFLFGTLGDLMINIGIAVIGIGEAIMAIVESLVSLQGWKAIAAGAALIIAGGALKALAKNAGGTPAAAGSVTGSGGAAQVGTSTNPEVAPRADQERTEPGKTVIVNVEGSLFSTEQTSKTLISMLAKEFDKTGAQIRRRSFA
jgi:hypothetical protein